MAYTPIVIGSMGWGTPVNNAFIDQDNRITQLNRQRDTTGATDHNLITWSWDPATNLASSTLTSGTVFMSKMWVREPATITNLVFGVATLGTGLTAGQNFAGLYNAAGTRLGVTADQTATWGAGAIGAQDIPIAGGPVAVPAGAYYLALLSVGGTTPAFARGSSAASGGSTVNVRLTAATARFAVGPAGQTSLPASITMASRTADQRALWTAFG